MVNLMTFRNLFAVALLGLGISLTAHGDVVSQAYEVALSDFRAPATENGGVAFKTCSTCERQVVRVTEQTRYAINGKAVRFDDFRKAVTRVRDRDDATVIVLHHLESDTVVSLDVSI